MTSPPLRRYLDAALILWRHPYVSVPVLFLAGVIANQYFVLKETAYQAFSDAWRITDTAIERPAVQLSIAIIALWTIHRGIVFVAEAVAEAGRRETATRNTALLEIKGALEDIERLPILMAQRYLDLMSGMAVIAAIGRAEERCADMRSFLQHLTRGNETRSSDVPYSFSQGCQLIQESIADAKTTLGIVDQFHVAAIHDQPETCGESMAFDPDLNRPLLRRYIESLDTIEAELPKLRAAEAGRRNASAQVEQSIGQEVSRLQLDQL